MKRRIAMVLICLLMTGTLFSCKDAGGKKNESIADDSVVKIKILTTEFPDPNYKRNWDREGMAAIKKVALEKFKLDLELEEIIPNLDQARSVLTTRFAAGVDLPDVIRFDYTIGEINELYQSGHILNLSEYAQYMPNVVKAFEQIPSMKLYNCTPDGSILRIPQVTYNIQHVTWWANIRKDWLDQLGMAMPKTTEEYRNTLRAFQENDMNKNGKKDEGIYTNYETMNAVLAPAFGALGIQTANTSWYADSNGKVYHAMLTDNARKYVEYVAGLFAEGLVWDGSFSSTAEDGQKYVNENRLAGSFEEYWGSLLKNIDGYSKNRPAEYANLYPLTDGKNPALIMVQNFQGQTSSLLTSVCKVPERVVAFYNWFMSKEGSDIAYFGETTPGGNYYKELPISDKLDLDTMKAIGLKGDEKVMELTDKGKALTATESDYRAYLGINNSLWPIYSIDKPQDIAIEFFFGFDRKATRSASDIIMNYEKLSWPGIEGNSYNNILLAVMDENQIDVIRNAGDLYVYMDEMYRKFMTGVEPLSKWDDFVSQCEKQGLSKVMAVQQARYDTGKAMK